MLHETLGGVRGDQRQARELRDSPLFLLVPERADQAEHEQDPKGPKDQLSAARSLFDLFDIYNVSCHGRTLLRERRWYIIVFLTKQGVNDALVGEEDPDQVVRDVGRKIAEFRQARGLTQEEVAEMLGIALRNYQEMERGKQNLTLRTMVNLASVLGVRTSQLLDQPLSRDVKRGRPKKQA